MNEHAFLAIAAFYFQVTALVGSIARGGYEFAARCASSSEALSILPRASVGPYEFGISGSE